MSDQSLNLALSVRGKQSLGSHTTSNPATAATRSSNIHKYDKSSTNARILVGGYSVNAQ